MIFAASHRGPLLFLQPGCKCLHAVHSQYQPLHFPVPPLTSEIDQPMSKGIDWVADGQCHAALNHKHGEAGIGSKIGDQQNGLRPRTSTSTRAVLFSGKHHPWKRLNLFRFGWGVKG